MPDPIPDLAKSNADVIAQQKAQDIAGQSTATGQFGAAIDALDALASKVVAKPDAPPPDDAAASKADAPKPDAPPPDAAAVAAAAELAAKADEYFKDSPKLPPNASPKSSEAFSSIKQKAAQEISAREQQIEELRKKLEDASKPGTEVLEKEKELEELRSWRAKLDVDSDPKFKEHDKGIEQSREFIYAQLAKNPSVTPEIIEQIKKIGGPDKIDLVKLFGAINDPTLQRMVEAKVADIEMAKYRKEEAIKAAKENLTGYMQERQQAAEKAANADGTAVSEKLGGLLGKLEWFSEKPLDPKADANVKTQVEEHNKFVADLKTQIEAASKDNSPEMRAILLTGMAQLFNLQRRLPALEATLAAKDKALAEVTAKWEAVKGASRSRLNESAAPAGGIPGATKSGVDVNTRTGDVLDDIARQVMEKKAAAASGQ
jgi:hypothetical protein